MINETRVWYYWYELMRHYDRESAISNNYVSYIDFLSSSSLTLKYDKYNGTYGSWEGTLFSINKGDIVDLIDGQVIQKFIDNTYTIRQMLIIALGELWDKPAYMSDKEYDLYNTAELSDIDDKNLEHFIGSVTAFILRTMDYYVPLINLYEKNKDKLMNTLQTGHVTYQDDTPVNPFNIPLTKTETNKHISYQTKSVSETELSTMTRLDEIQRTLKQLYGDWAKEFVVEFGGIYE